MRDSVSSVGQARLQSRRTILRYPLVMPFANGHLFVLTALLVIAPACRTPSSTSGVDVAGMDTSIAPGDDFNAYTNGGWIKATPIPADKASYGIDTILIDEHASANLRLSRSRPNQEPPTPKTAARSPTSIRASWTKAPSNPRASLR